MPVNPGRCSHGAHLALVRTLPHLQDVGLATAK